MPSSHINFQDYNLRRSLLWKIHIQTYLVILTNCVPTQFLPFTFPLLNIFSSGQIERAKILCMLLSVVVVAANCRSPSSPSELLGGFVCQYNDHPLRNRVPWYLLKMRSVILPEKARYMLEKVQWITMLVEITLSNWEKQIVQLLNYLQVHARRFQIDSFDLDTLPNRCRLDPQYIPM